MQTFFKYEDIPIRAAYIGSLDGDDCLSEAVRDRLDHAVEPARLLTEDGSVSYFDLQPY